MCSADVQRHGLDSRYSRKGTAWRAALLGHDVDGQGQGLLDGHGDKRSLSQGWWGFALHQQVYIAATGLVVES